MEGSDSLCQLILVAGLGHAMVSARSLTRKNVTQKKKKKKKIVLHEVDIFQVIQIHSVSFSSFPRTWLLLLYVQLDCEINT